RFLQRYGNADGGQRGVSFPITIQRAKAISTVQGRRGICASVPIDQRGAVTVGRSFSVERGASKREAWRYLRAPHILRPTLYALTLLVLRFGIAAGQVA